MKYTEDDIILEMILHTETRNEGFRCLVGKYKEKLYWHIRRLVGDHEDADDVLQNTFVKVFRNADTFQKQSALFTWIYRIATNESLNLIEAKKKKQTEELDQAVVYSLRSSTDVEGDWILTKLSEAIQILPEKQKLVFNLRYYDEMSYQDIADITNTSVGALKASYHHAVKKIEEHLTQEK